MKIFVEYAGPHDTAKDAAILACIPQPGEYESAYRNSDSKRAFVFYVQSGGSAVATSISNCGVTLTRCETQ